MSPRQRQRNPKALLYTAGAIVTVAVVAAVVFLLSRPSADDHDAATIGRSTTATPQAPPTQNADEERLLRMVPRGYAQDACRTADASNGASAQVNCGRNSDAGGPLSATYTLAAGKAELDAAFNDAMADAERVNCPGNIQSPGPWRRNAAPEKVAGTLFCGLRDGRPTVAWTDDARLVVSVAHAGPSGPAFPELYAWWSSHS